MSPSPNHSRKRSGRVSAPHTFSLGWGSRRSKRSTHRPWMFSTVPWSLRSCPSGGWLDGMGYSSSSSRWRSRASSRLDQNRR
jgi:hypothetical protein